MTSPSVPYFSFSDLAKRVWWYPVVRGLLAVVLGIIVMANPATTVIVLVRIIGVFVIIDGVMGIVDGARYRGVSGSGWQLRLFGGVVGLLLGGALLFWPEASLTVLAVILGAWAIIGGILAVVAGYGMRKIPGSGWGWTLFWGLATFAFGLVLLLAPLEGVSAIAWAVGLYAVLAGIVLVVAGFAIRSLGKRAAALGD